MAWRGVAGGWRIRLGGGVRVGAGGPPPRPERHLSLYVMFIPPSVSVCAIK